MTKQLRVSERTTLLNTYATLVIAKQVLDFLDDQTAPLVMRTARKQIHNAAKELGLSRATASRTISRISNPIIKLVNAHLELRDKAKSTVEQYSEPLQPLIKEVFVKIDQRIIHDITKRVEATVNYLEQNPEEVKNLDNYITQDILH